MAPDPRTPRPARGAAVRGHGFTRTVRRRVRPQGLPLTVAPAVCPIGQGTDPGSESRKTKTMGSWKMYLKHGVCRAAAFAALMAGTAPVALFAETPADTLVIADAIDDIVSIDPHEAFEFSGLDLTNNLYDTLIELDPTRPGELVPGLAESWSVSEDGLTYTFKIK